MAARPFWKEKTLKQMTSAEWESLCDGCAKCCLVKLEDELTGRVSYTDISCKLLDTATCRCVSYAQRHALVPGCARLTMENVESFHWLPKTCAYRLLNEGKDLPTWHHLISCDQEVIHRLGFSVKGKIIPEQLVHPDDITNHTVEWE